jgi:haloacetate dehalogenase
MFENFTGRTIDVGGGLKIFARIGGDGPPLLLLHGYPETHLCWRKIAQPLAERFTVVAADLRGYGDSSKPGGGERHANYAKRAMAQDQVEVMRALGFERFRLVGHDRGGRVAHRLALDHPDRVERLAVLDIAPTATMYRATDRAFAQAYYHWFFLIQPFDLPERLIGADSAYYLRRSLAAWSRGAFEDEVVADYVRCFASPGAIHATCEDYRAAAGIDLEHDAADAAAGRRLRVPLLALWGGQGVVGRLFDVAATWRAVSDAEVRGRDLPCGHFLPEEKPQETLAALLEFL